MATGTEASASLQIQTLKMFTALTLAREGWGGVLVLGGGLRGPGRALALATLGVGAAGLFLESDPAVLRAAQREGCCTFSVTTLDEALRALKNEVRQERAITVGLGGAMDGWLGEIAERGVLADVVGSESSEGVPGRWLLHGLGLVRCGAASLDLEALLPQGWSVTEEVAASMAERRQQDASIAPDGPMADVMRAWMRVAPSLFPRDRGRAQWAAETPDLS